MSLLILKKSNDWLLFREKTVTGKSIGFVPTMGALHDGHLSLIRRSKAENDITLCSIFINRAQFNDPNDYLRYPVDIENDILKLSDAGCDVLFLPFPEEMYPEGSPQLRKFDLGEWENILEGADRPGHFQAVANVVDRLLNKIQPDKMYLGQKDYQQSLILDEVQRQGIRKLKIVMCPIIREADGLAMSSRNRRLNAEDRQNATGIYKVLLFVKENFKNNSIEYLENISIETLNKIPNAKVAYFKILDAEALQEVGKSESPEVGKSESRKVGKSESREVRRMIAITSVVIGGTRLLDNIILD